MKKGENVLNSTASLEILEELAHTSPLFASELARRRKRNSSTLVRQIQELSASGFIREKETQGRNRLIELDQKKITELLVRRLKNRIGAPYNSKLETDRIFEDTDFRTWLYSQFIALLTQNGEIELPTLQTVLWEFEWNVFDMVRFPSYFPHPGVGKAANALNKLYETATEARNVEMWKFFKKVEKNDGKG